MKHHLRSGQEWHVFSRNLTVLPAHSHVHLLIGMSYTYSWNSHLQLVLIYQPQKDGRLSWPGFLGYVARSLPVYLICSWQEETK